MQTRWQIQTKLPPAVNESLAKFPPVLRQLLFNRGYATDEEARAFLKATPDFDTSPWGLKDMDVTIERIIQAIEGKEKIIIYGDYDVDGITSSALLVELLRSFGANVTAYIPDRFKEGYGLNIEALDGFSAQNVDLVITVDCGIRAVAQAEYARGLGLDLIITDHHHPGMVLPNALAVLDPKREDDTYGEKMLAGVGIAYKIAEALMEKIGKKSSLALVESLLDLVALGTVADLAPLEGENHRFVRRGLRVMRPAQRQG